MSGQSYNKIQLISSMMQVRNTRLAESVVAISLDFAATTVPHSL